MAIQKASVPPNSRALTSRQVAGLNRRMRTAEGNPYIRSTSDVEIHGANIGAGDDGAAAFNANVNSSSITAGLPGHTVNAQTDESAQTSGPPTPVAVSDRITYDGVVFQKVPPSNPSPLPDAEPSTPIEYHEHPGTLYSPPLMSGSGTWDGLASDQMQHVGLDVRWPASLTANLPRVLFVVDMTAMQAAFEGTPVEVGTGGDSLEIHRGYGLSNAGFSGYGWNWPGYFTLSTPLDAWAPTEFPGDYMAHDRFPDSVMVYPLDFTPQLNDPADAGGYMFVGGDLIWPAGVDPPTVDWYLPQWEEPPTTGNGVTHIVTSPKGQSVHQQKVNSTSWNWPAPPAPTLANPKLGALKTSSPTTPYGVTYDGEGATFNCPVIVEGSLAAASLNVNGIDYTGSQAVFGASSFPFDTSTALPAVVTFSPGIAWNWQNLILTPAVTTQGGSLTPAWSGAIYPTDSSETTLTAYITAIQSPSGGVQDLGFSWVTLA